MKSRFYFTFVILASALVPLVLNSCSKPAAQTAANANVDYWTCTMHPSVHSKDPGKCPICSMDLVPVMKKAALKSENMAQKGETKSATSPGSMEGMNMGSGGKAQGESSGSTEFTVPVERQQQIGVTYATAKKRPIELSIRSVGILESDTSKSFDYVARVDGYVQDLKVDSPGQDVMKGQPLLTVYSPDLHSTEQELVNLLNDRDRGGGSRASNDQLIDASKRRLKLWNVSDQEIATLEKSRQPSDQLMLRSPFDGVVNEVMGRPGMNVKMGDKLVSVLDLSTLWVWAEFYENEIGLLKTGQTIDVSLPAFPNQTFQGKIAVINPMIDAAKRTSRVRIDIPNPKAQLRPGMYANVEVKIDDGEGLTIPVQAALPTGERMLVFLDRGEGKLLPRYVQVGRSFTTFDGQEQGSYYQVLKGLQEGDRIVSSANFLIDAESQVQGALKDWQGEQPGSTPTTTEKPSPPPSNSNLSAPVKPVLDSYKRIHELLTENKFSEIPANSVLLRKKILSLFDIAPSSKPERYKELASRLAGSADRFTPKDIDQARVEFGQLSADLIAFLKEFMPELGDPLYTVKCPMWNKSPAVLLQDSTDVKNPFLGPDMLACGTVQETLQAER
ncbi:MAG TPA: efflux RND transporter periplasmic adaptor subunit [Chthoniobacterales bacterium]|nr:efflux RND transporter periplasmic adaptor subunit [Chthoniobacterales bacterium]